MLPAVTLVLAQKFSSANPSPCPDPNPNHNHNPCPEVVLDDLLQHIDADTLKNDSLFMQIPKYVELLRCVTVPHLRLDPTKAMTEEEQHAFHELEVMTKERIFGRPINSLEAEHTVQLFGAHAAKNHTTNRLDDLVAIKTQGSAQMRKEKLEAHCERAGQSRLQADAESSEAEAAAAAAREDAAILAHQSGSGESLATEVSEAQLEEEAATFNSKMSAFDETVRELATEPLVDVDAELVKRASPGSSLKSSKGWRRDMSEKKKVRRTSITSKTIQASRLLKFVARTKSVTTEVEELAKARAKRLQAEGTDRLGSAKRRREEMMKGQITLSGGLSYDEYNAPASKSAPVAPLLVKKVLNLEGTNEKTIGAKNSLEFWAAECECRGIKVKRQVGGANAGKISGVTIDKLKEELKKFHKGATVIPRMSAFDGRQVGDAWASQVGGVLPAVASANAHAAACEETQNQKEVEAWFTELLDKRFGKPLPPPGAEPAPLPQPPPARPPSRRYKCAVCANTYTATASGLLRAHGPKGTPCLGSNSQLTPEQLVAPIG